MSLQVDFTLQTEAWINAPTQQCGRWPADLVRRVIEESAATKSAPPTREADNNQDATIALLQSWIAEDATDDPEEIRRPRRDGPSSSATWDAPARKLE